VLRNRFLRLASVIIFGLCLTWVGVVHATYFVTGEREVPEVWIAPLRGTAAIYPAVALLFFQYFFVAFGLFLGILLLPSWARSPALVGLLAGLLVGLWANTEFLAVPYCGACASLPGAMLGTVLSGGENRGPGYYVPVLLTNVLLWSLTGWCLGWLPFVRRWVRRAESGAAADRPRD